MKPLNQNDLRWAGIRLGSSNLRVGAKGCAFIGLLNAWRFLTRTELTPQQVVAMASNAANFTDQNYKYGAGLILWERVCAQLSKIGGREFVYTGPERGYMRANLLTALKDPNRAAILEVNSGAHFSLLWSKPLLGNDLNIADSWDGRIKKAAATYHNISGARYFRLK